LKSKVEIMNEIRKVKEKVANNIEGENTRERIERSKFERSNEFFKEMRNRKKKQRNTSLNLTNL